jgi:hypothetical protein
MFLWYKIVYNIAEDSLVIEAQTIKEIPERMASER